MELTRLLQRVTRQSRKCSISNPDVPSAMYQSKKSRLGPIRSPDLMLDHQFKISEYTGGRTGAGGIVGSLVYEYEL